MVSRWCEVYVEIITYSEVLQKVREQLDLKLHRLGYIKWERLGAIKL